LNVQETRLLDTASLIGDLGGGWSDAELHDPRDPDKAPATAASGTSAPAAASAPAPQGSGAASGQGAQASVQ
jgi:hypothetical protein